MQPVSAAGNLKTISGSNSAGRQYKPYQIATDAPVYNYKVQGHDLNTYALKDTAGQEWYLTDGGQWRNAQTKALQAAAPTWAAAAAPAPAAPAAPVDNAPTPTVAAPTYKSIWDFMPKDQAGAFTMPSAPTMAPSKSYLDFVPKDIESSPTYQYAVKTGQKDLTADLARKGLLGSGAELEANQRMRDKALADESARLTEGAKADAENYNTRSLAEYQANSASRNSTQSLLASLIGNDYSTYQAQQDSERDREIDKDGQKITTLGLTLDFLKSLNPLQYGYNAATATGENQVSLGKILAQLAGGGGGGGGSSGGSTAANLPASSGQTFDSTNYWINAAANILPSLFSAIKG